LKRHSFYTGEERQPLSFITTTSSVREGVNFVDQSGDVITKDDNCDFDGSDVTEVDPKQTEDETENDDCDFDGSDVTEVDLVALEDLGDHKIANRLSGPFSVIDKMYIPGKKQRKSSRCGFQKASPKFKIPTVPNEQHGKKNPQTKITKATRIPAKAAKKSAPKKPVSKKPAAKKPAAKKPAAKPGDKRTRAPIVMSEAEAKVSFQDESTPSTNSTSNESSNSRRLQDFLELQAMMKSRDAYEAQIKYEQSLRNNK
jgi:hypothetical protein